MLLNRGDLQVKGKYKAEEGDELWSEGERTANS